MKTKLLEPLLFATFAATALLAAPARSADKEEVADTMVTVYVSAHDGSSMVKDVNAMHVRMEAKGWRFADLAVHVENEDTEGAWVTYVRDRAMAMGATE